MHGTNMKICIPDVFTTRLLVRRSGVRFPESAGDFLFFAMSILSLGPSVHWVPEPYSPGLSQPEREVKHILRPFLGLTMMGCVPVLPPPPYAVMVWTGSLPLIVFVLKYINVLNQD